MKAPDIEKYIGHSVRIVYERENERHSRTGILTAVSLRRVSLLLFVEDTDNDEEASIRIKNIKRIYKLKAKDC